jgi:RHS repeat-associated protein
MFNTPINISQPSQQFEYTIGFYVDNSYDNELIKSYLLATNNKPVLLGYNWTMPINSNYYLPITVESCYNELERFGSMYKEWGQFFYNENLDNSTTIPSDNNGKLLNSYYIDKEFNGNTSGYSNYNCGNSSDAGYQECMANANINNLNSSQYDDPNTIPETPTDPMYNEINPVFLIANPQRNYVCDNKKCDYLEKWTGVYDSQYTTFNAFFSGSFEDSSYGTIFTDTNLPEQIVQADLNNGMMATSKLVESVSVSKTTGWSPLSLTKNESRYSNTNLDFMDINGDRYPDIISSNNVKTTRMTGGHNDSVQHNYGVIASNSNNGRVLTSFGYGNATGTSFLGSLGFGNSEGNPAAFLTNFPIQPSLNLGTVNKENTFWMDLNGDGLSDRITNSGSNLQYHLNTGGIDANVSYEPYNLLVANQSTPTPIGLSIGVPFSLNSLFDDNSLPFSIGLSIGASFNGTSTKATFIDINGDGLVDLLDSNSFKLNLGNGFSITGIPFYTPSLATKTLLNDNGTSTASISGEASRFFRVYSWFKWPKWLRIFHIKAGVTASGNASLTLSNSKKSFKDFNGDGHIDLIEKIDDDIYVYQSRIRRTNKLKAVTNPLGGSFTIDYKVQPVDYKNPHPKWAMSSVEINDGFDKVNDGNDTIRKVYKYENGKYDRRERDFYGYETVSTLDYPDGNTTTPYRTSISKYHNESYFLNGLLKESYVIKGNDENQKYSKTSNFYEVRQLSSNNQDMTLTVLSNLFDVGGTEGRKSAAVVMTKTITELYELAPTPQITTQVEMTYDTKGRIINYSNLGNTALTNDNYSATITYHSLANNIINVPKEIKVIVNRATVRRRITTVNTATGSLATIAAYNNTVISQTSLKYDLYGNSIHIDHPANAAVQRMFYDYTFDPLYHKYVTNIKDAFGYSSSATYNSDFDKIKETVDLTGNKMIYKYDTFGRNTSIIAPKEVIAVKPYTIKFDYYPYLSLLPATSGVTEDTFVPVAVTHHYDQQHPDNDIQTYTFIDGLARPIQIKKDITLNSSEDHQESNYYEALSISGKTYFDEFGRAIQQFHPYFETKTDARKFLLNEDPSPFSATTLFDELDRPVKTIDPGDNVSTLEYSIDGDNTGEVALKTKSTTDQNGSQSIVTETYKNVSGKVIATMNLGATALWTNFNYDAIGQLMNYKDAQGFVTDYKYDLLGRKIFVNHPDNGTTTFKYDPASNLVQLQTANLAAAGTFVNYNYQYNRLKEIIYPVTPTGRNLGNVTYQYGVSGINAGRLIQQDDATGLQKFEYGNMGEVVANVRTVVAPNLPTRVFNTSYSYDSWNRLQTMIYPDQEKVTYNYDFGGNLTRMTGQVNSQPYNYIDRIDYDYYEQRAYLKYGNKTETYYNYTPALRRLENLNVKTADTQDLYNNFYKYDKVGNVTSLVNQAGATANTMGGNYGHSFIYDNLNRLAGASGYFKGDGAQQEFNNDFQSDYTIKMQYNATHGIENKTQMHYKNLDATPFAENSYSNTYKYQNLTHKVLHIDDGRTGATEDFKYDLNGNLIYKTNTDGNDRSLYWDESNRLRVVNDRAGMQHYIYDASGERILKANSNIEAIYGNGSLLDPATTTINSYTTYPSANLVIDSHGIYSKHYYAGTQRIVSRIGEQSSSIFGGDCTGCKTTETDNKLQELQKTNLQQILAKGKLGQAAFKPYQPYTYDEAQKALAEEDKENLKETLAPPLGAGGLYFYHPDHLGTSTFLTDYNGNAYQFFLNLPFGETMAEQLGSNYYNTPYKFNGKELDEETGLYYYGARYYDPRVSIWLSVDPLAEKYPNVSPYVYCFNNPVLYVDPDGRDPRIIFVNGYLMMGELKGGKDYWNKSFRDGAVGYFTESFKGMQETYVNYNPSFYESASSRFDSGYEYAKEHYSELTQNMNMKEDSFNFVTHSMGTAHGEGMSKYLQEMGWKIDTEVHINAYQAADITAQTTWSFKDPTKVIDYQNTDDPVINNPIRSSPGDIKGATSKIREDSGVKDIEYIHASPIGKGKGFWKELDKKAEE